MNKAQRKEISKLAQAVSHAMAVMTERAEAFGLLANPEAGWALTSEAGQAARAAYVGNMRDLFTEAGVVGNLEQHRDDEQDKYDNMPEGLQNSDSGEAMQAGIDALEEAISELESAESTIEDAISDVENAKDEDELDDACSKLEDAILELENCADMIESATCAA